MKYSSILWWSGLIIVIVLFALGVIQLNDIKPFCSNSTQKILNTAETFFNEQKRDLPNRKKHTRKVSESLKKQIASDQQWLCKSCKKLLDYTYEIDHVIPLFKGGSNDKHNLQALCRSCHGIKTHHENL